MKKLFTLLLLALSISAFSTSITFKVCMKGSGMEYDSVFVVGKSLIGPGATKDWEFIYMAPEGAAADSLYSVVLNVTKGDTVVFYFSTDDDWATYLDYRETVPDTCAQSDEITGDAGWNGDRAFIVPETALFVGYYYSSCEEVAAPPVQNGLKLNSIQNFEIYPNPAQSSVTIKLNNGSAEALVLMQDLTGKTVQSPTISGSSTLDIEDIPNGLYFVKVTVGDVSSVQKLLVY